MKSTKTKRTAHDVARTLGKPARVHNTLRITVTPKAHREIIDLFLKALDKA